MHPDAALREKGCQAPQEKVPGDSQYTVCSGYVDHPSKLGAQDNVAYFADLARRHLGSLECRRQVLRWLGSLTHAELLAGIKVRPCRTSKRGSQLLTEMILTASGRQA